MRRIAEQRRLKGEEEALSTVAAAIIDPIFTDFSLNTTASATADSLSRGQLRFSLPPGGSEDNDVVTGVSVTAATTPRFPAERLTGFTVEPVTTAAATTGRAVVTAGQQQLTGAAAASLAQQLTGVATATPVQQLSAAASARLLSEPDRFPAGRTTANRNKNKRFAGSGGAASGAHGAAAKRKNRRTPN